MKLTQTTPLLRSFNEAQAKQFYIDFLGFELLFEHRFEPGLPLYFAVKRDACELHLTEHHGDATPGASVRIACEDVDAYCATLAAQNAAHTRPSVQEQPWGTRDFTVTDPFGNRLTFTSAVSL
jgi:uncharacterized glyoxalase superfamily protein PhnB